jgi:hypothetical protein
MTAVCQTSRKGKDANVVGRFSVADAKRAGLWGKSGPWTQYPKRMLQLRARGFALRDAFPDVLKGLVTAEEAQDYPANEPAMIRPQGEPARPLTNSVKDVAPGITVAHVERFEPAAAVVAATPGDMERSRLAVNKAAKVGDLERMQSVTEQRLKSGFYTPAQADELLNLINGKLDWLASEPDDKGTEFPHEAAEHEVAS